MRVILVNGMRRSGNHPIISWIVSHFPSAIHFNNVSMRTKPMWKRPTSVQCFTDGAKFSGKDNRAAIEAQDLSPFSAVIISTEDKTPAQADEILDKHFPDLDEWESIVILRSFYNTYVSRDQQYKKIMKKPTPMFADNYCLDRCVSVWPALADKSLEENQILFDKWVESPKYRRQASKRLGLGKNPIFDMDHVPSAGGGSSFSGTKEKGTEMDVNGRYKYFDFPTFPKVIAKENKRLFGWRV